MFNIAPDDHTAYKTMLAYDQLRYRLMPYIYSLTGMVTQNDYTIMRALVMDFGYDKNVTNIGDQFMFGPALLVNPITEYKARMRTVYLPSGCSWYDLKTGKHYAGGQPLLANAPYEDIPIFVRSGSILPCGPSIQYASEKNADTIRLFIYTGNDASFNLYEDENVNYNYEKGEFATIPFNYNEKQHELTIGKRVGNFTGMLHTRAFEIVWISDKKSVGLDFQIKPDTLVTYDGSQQIVTQP
jgi:alpha-D-xyloside xylohydrolase